MTRKTFILAGLFVIALGSLSIALQSYLFVSEIISNETAIYFDLFCFVAIPLAFGLLLWKRLRYIGRSRRFTAHFFAGFLATFYIAAIIFPINLWLLLSGFNPSGAMTNEIAAWSKSGGEGDFSFTIKAKLQMATFNAILETLGSWPLYAALFFGALDPRFPKGVNWLGRLSKRITEKCKAVTSSRKQTAS